MKAVKWFGKRSSWHLWVPGSRRTLCGRPQPEGGFAIPFSLDYRRFRDTLPGDEKTCERCAVIAAKRAIPRDPRDPSDEGPA